MPVKMIEVSQLPSIERHSKLSQTKEWQEVLVQLKNPLPQSKALTVVLSDETVSQYTKGSKDKNHAMKRAIGSFRQKLKTTYHQYQVKVIGNELIILNRSYKSANAKAANAKAAKA